jgi:hypothetical protein
VERAECLKPAEVEASSHGTQESKEDTTDLDMAWVQIDDIDSLWIALSDWLDCDPSY